MADENKQVERLARLANTLSESKDVDVLLFCGPIKPPDDEKFIELIENCAKKPNLIFLINTYGGSAHSAYRIAKCLQRKYSSGVFEAYVDRECSSAGTLLVIGADGLIMSDLGQLGPLDVQLRKTDEVGERSSGLTPMQALSALQEQSYSFFKEYFIRLRYDEVIGMASKMASEIASDVCVGLFQSIFQQIDPMRLGELDRLVKVALEYGKRLQNYQQALGKSKNLKDKSLENLIAGYPSHEFVIDRIEAKELFEKVRLPNEEEEAVASNVREIARATLLRDSPFFGYLSQIPIEKESEGKNDGHNTQGDRTNQGGEEQGSGETNGDYEERDKPTTLEKCK